MLNTPHNIFKYIVIESKMTCRENAAPRDMTIPHLFPEVAIVVTKKPSLHFLFIHL